MLAVVRLLACWLALVKNGYPPPRVSGLLLKRFRHVYFSGVLVLVSSALSAQAMSFEGAEYLRKDYQLYQAWSLGRNYFFGTTVISSRKKALAWQMVYVSLLPSTYPAKNNLLAFYQRGLSKTQLADASILAENYRKKYDLQGAFTEEQLNQAYVLRDEVDAWDKLQFDLPPKAVWRHFGHWLSWLAEQQRDTSLAVILDSKANQLNLEKKFPIVFGQVLVKGPEPVAMVNSDVQLLKDGFFVAQAKNSSLSFSLPGYYTVTIPVNSRAQVQGIAPVVMIKQPHGKGTGVVGRVLPWKGVEQGNIVLTRDETEKSTTNQDPWYHPVIPLTVTNNGEFYATGLVPGAYHVVINTAGLSTSIKFTAKEGEIRGLSLIDLRKKLAH